jgi:hypothetical protein
LLLLMLLFMTHGDDLEARARHAALERKGCVSTEGRGCPAMRARVDEHLPAMMRGCKAERGPDDLCVALAVAAAHECGAFGRCIAPDSVRYNPGERSVGWFQLTEGGRHWRACEEYLEAPGQAIAIDAELAARCVAWRVRYLLEHRLPRVCDQNEIPAGQAWGVALSAFGVGRFDGCGRWPVREPVCVDRVCRREVVAGPGRARVSEYWTAALGAPRTRR